LCDDNDSLDKFFEKDDDSSKGSQDSNQSPPQQCDIDLPTHVPKPEPQVHVDM